MFAAEHPQQVCGGTREYLDRRTGEMLERLGSDQTKVDYYLLDDVSEYCSEDDRVYGCALPGVIYSETVPVLHEIVHARSGESMPPALEEGLATYFGDPFPLQHTPAPRERLTELLTTNKELASGAEYARAGHFVAFLAETFGWESLLALDAELSEENTSAELDAAFEKVLGVNTAGVLAAYQEFPECTGIVDSSIACAAPPASSDPFIATFERTLDCTSGDGVGPHHGMVFVEGVIEVGPSIDGSRILSATGDGATKGGFALIRRCGPCSEDGVMRTEGNGPFLVSEEALPAGRYLVRLYLPVEAAPATVGVRING